MPHTRATPRLQRRWLHASGGVVWHLRALRYRNSLWRDFTLTVGEWLRDWQPPVHKLLIIGPSAGYSLHAEFLQRWHDVVALEPDPLARHLLRRRFPGVRWRFDDMEVLSADANGFALLGQHFATHAILFSNILGQVSPRAEGVAHPWHAALRESLRRHHWASYHDVISTRRRPDASASRMAITSVELDEVIARFWHGGEVEVVDHCTFGLVEPGGHARKYCIWPLRVGHYHLVEWQQAAPAAGSHGAAEAPAGKDC